MTKYLQLLNELQGIIEEVQLDDNIIIKSDFDNALSDLDTLIYVEKLRVRELCEEVLYN